MPEVSDLSPWPSVPWLPQAVRDNIIKMLVMHKNSFFIFNLFYQHLFCAVLLLLSFLEIQIKLFRKSSLISWENIFKFLLTSALILVIILRQFAWRCISDAVICGFDYMNRCRNSHCIKSEDSIINMQVWRNWQTRMVQVHVNASSCRFKSCYLHHITASHKVRRIFMSQ